MGRVLLSGGCLGMKAPVTGIPAGTLAVRATVKVPVNGAAREFIVIHQGRPAAMYDESCNGTWLLMKDCYENRQWHSSNNNDCAASTIHSYLNGAFLNLFDANIKAAIKQVKLPYRPGAGYGKNVNTGASGLSAKIFLLSSEEVSFTHDYMPTGEGAELAYFKGCADTGSDSKRVAKLNGSAVVWWLRSPYCNSNFGASNALCVVSDGDWNSNPCSYSYAFALRPALVLDSAALFDKNTLVLKGVA